MTSSIRHLKPGQPKWNYEIQKYKDHDPFHEPGLISILVLSCGKPKLTKVCLESTLKAASLYKGETEWIFVDNDFCEENYTYFMGLSIERKVIVRQSNYGINHGFNQAWRLSRGQYIMILENDWYNMLPQFNFLQASKDILDHNVDIGNIQLRFSHDQNENWGSGKEEFCPWSVQFGTLYPVQTRSGFKVCHFPNAFNNNPQIYRKTIYDKLGPYFEAQIGSDPRNGETEYARKYWKETFYKTGYIKGIYVHAGGAARFIYENGTYV